MTERQRTSLANMLVSRFLRTPDGPTAREAMRAWLMVQSARLRTLSPQANDHAALASQSGLQAAGFPERMNFDERAGLPARQAAAAPFQAAHEASIRPEYALALNDFLRCLNPQESLDDKLRKQVRQAFNHQMLVAGTISPQVCTLVGRHGVDTLAREKYRLGGTGNFKSEAERAGGAQQAPSATPDVPQSSASSSRRRDESLSRSDENPVYRAAWMTLGRDDLPK